jgi:tetratricopeptide (TPR) repeat protein
MDQPYSPVRGGASPAFAIRTAVVVLLLAWTAGFALASRADLARALALYNQRRFDQAIEAASAARKNPETQDAAAVVLARAHLERYREGVDPADLSAAREALGAVRSAALDPRTRLEYVLALGQALFLEDEYGAAAQVFASAVAPARAIDLSLAEALVDWWGSATERQADLSAPDERRALFHALADAMRDEQADNPESAAAAYWLAAALRGAGDPMNAWHAATAGWVRARLAGSRSAGLRADLDKLVLQGIIPDRVRPLAPTDRAAAESQLRADWELIKERWR